VTQSLQKKDGPFGNSRQAGHPRNRFCDPAKVKDSYSKRKGTDRQHPVNDYVCPVPKKDLVEHRDWEREQYNQCCKKTAP
jgi:hypothetical protein